MKSPMLDNVYGNDEKEKGRYSEMQVLRSAAGYYVGTIYRNPEGYVEPGSRDSGYFRTKEEAQTFLDKVEKTGDISELRMTP